MYIPTRCMGFVCHQRITGRYRFCRPLGDHGGLSAIILPIPPSIIASILTESLGVTGTDSIAQRATATVLRYYEGYKWTNVKKTTSKKLNGDDSLGTVVIQYAFMHGELRLRSEVYRCWISLTPHKNSSRHATVTLRPAWDCLCIGNITHPRFATLFPIIHPFTNNSALYGCPSHPVVSANSNDNITSKPSGTSISKDVTKKPTPALLPGKPAERSRGLQWTVVKPGR